ncbi:MAG: NAD-dependent epimerase/dehydratase family protein, partial [Proteobacteria bacterium]|nr:NAD-dependent epimerase/dehydratase family protein [Pseudomonadota bacterium]
NLYRGNGLPWREGMPVFPTSLYTEARYFIERLADIYKDLYGTKGIGLRLFSVYGLGEEAKGRLANLISQMVWARQKNEEFLVYGNGLTTRDSIFVSDVVRAFILAMEGTVDYGIYNVGTGRHKSVRELAELIGTKLVFGPNPMKNYTHHQLADTRVAERLLGFESRISVEEGIKCLLNLQ